MQEHADAQQAYANGEELRDVCDINGLSREDFVHGRLHVHCLEMFLTGFSDMCVFTWFPALKELQLIQCGLSEITGLDNCMHLERLWLNENNLTAIGGLERCTKLTELYLYSNSIGQIEGLDTLVNLEVLWLQENRITEVKGLQNCPKLRTLSLASNLIESVCGRLDNQVALEDLNLACNKIGSFRDIPYLDKLPSLRSISFADPHFGANPVCQLCNYQTYTIYHLRKITKLDCLMITDDQRHLAEATFVKKKMYYNMRIKTLKRNTTNLLKKGTQFKQSKTNEIGCNLNALLKTFKLLQRELHEHERNAGHHGDGPSPEDMREHLSLVSSHIDTKLEEIEAIGRLYEEMRSMVQSSSLHHISRFMVELQTGGNVRLEDGKPSDMWYKSCVDLVKSRFYAADFEQYGVKDIKVIKVSHLRWGQGPTIPAPPQLTRASEGKGLHEGPPPPPKLKSRTFGQSWGWRRCQMPRNIQ